MFFAPFAASGAIGALIAASSLMFSIWMAVDCWRNGREPYWIWIILVTGGVGAAMYFFLHYWDGSRLEYGLWERLAMGGKIRELRARAHHLDSCAAYEALGDLYFKARKLSLAEEAYRNALKRDSESFEAAARLGFTLVEAGNFEEAWKFLEPAYRKNPCFDEDRLVRYAAVCQAMRGRYDDARNLYEYFLRKHSYTEVQVEYGEVLLKMGEREASRKVLQEVIEDTMHSPKFVQRRDRRWIREAKKLLKES